MEEEHWRKKLSKSRYRILRERGTEPAFSGELLDNKKEGSYVCAGCGQLLFTSEAKFDSGSGWPSFYEAEDGVESRPDSSLFMRRTEILCSGCKGHLGHVFDDGPKPTGKRYCVNSLSLEFKER